MAIFQPAAPMARLLCATILAGAFSAPLFAQTTAEAALAADAETIVITGSRIASRTLGSAPVQVIGAVNIQESGVTNIQEILLKNPVFGTPAISRTNSNFSTASAGVSTIDLRNLGTQRTLVLIDGRRTVSGVPGDTAVDLNTIPTAFIERVDILTGGSSALYGSDAVAGVVNFVYRKNFEGLEANAQFGIAEKGDDVRQALNVTMGANFDDNKGNVMLHLGYTNEGSVFSRDRSGSAVDQISLGALNGNNADLFTVSRPFFSSFAPQGRFFRAPGVTAGTFDGNNNFIPGFSTNGSATRAPDGFNRSAFRTIAVPTERYLFAARGTYEFADNVEAFVDTTFAATKTTTELEPFPLASTDLFPASGGFFNVENLDDNGVLTVNPFVPAGLLGLLSDNTGDGLRDVSFTRRLSDVANRGNTAERYTFRVVTGLQGEVFDGWRWDAFYSYGQTSENQVSSGQFNVVNFRNALNVTRDAGGQLVCLDVQAREEGCVPVNVFGRNTISADGLRYIDAPSFLSTLTRQQLFGGNISGELVDLWGAGAIGIAVGAEYRKEYARSEFDALQQAGLNGGNAIPRTEGSFDVIEAYGEIRIPLLSGVPFFDSLVATGAGRVSDYSTVGNTFSWNVGLEWSPIPDIKFRATRALATRAPNINELFSPPSQNFPTGLVDPCQRGGVTATSTGTLSDVCRASPGVNSNIAENGGTFTLNQSDIQGISGFDRGNPDLSEEKSRSWIVGAAINPRSIDALSGFTLTADYFNIKISDAIVPTPRQFILDQCYEQNNAALCQFVTRRPAIDGSNSAGSLDEIDSGVTNSGGLGTSGLDVVLNWQGDLVGGRIGASFAWTHYFTAYIVPLVGEAPDNYNGEIGAPKDRFATTLSWSTDNFGFTWRGTYLGTSYLDDQFTGVKAGAEGSSDFRVDPYFYMDVQARFGVGEKFEFYGGIDNLLDIGPAPIISGLPGNDTGTETDAGTYDAIGRRFYIGARFKF